MSAKKVISECSELLKQCNAEQDDKAKRVLKKQLQKKIENAESALFDAFMDMPSADYNKLEQELAVIKKQAGKTSSSSSSSSSSSVSAQLFGYGDDAQLDEAVDYSNATLNVLNNIVSTNDRTIEIGARASLGLASQGSKMNSLSDKMSSAKQQMNRKK